MMYQMDLEDIQLRIHLVNSESEFHTKFLKAFSDTITELEIDHSVIESITQDNKETITICFKKGMMSDSQKIIDDNKNVLLNRINELLFTNSFKNILYKEVI